MRLYLKMATGMFLLFQATFVFGKTPYGMAGCGLGSLIFSPNSGQISAATSNSYNQPFAITSGTSNCLEPTKAAAMEAQQQFFVDNLSTLSKEIAQGQGETLHAFSSTFGCEEIAYSAFATQLQSSFSKIFAAPGAMASLSVVQQELRDHGQLKNQCKFII